RSSIDPFAFGWTASGSIQDYISVREHVSGMYPTVDLIEFATDNYLKEEFNNPIIAKLRQGCARIASLTNDLFSYEKEVITRALPTNEIAFTQRKQKSTLAEAIEDTISVINMETSQFLEQADTVTHWGLPVLNQYIEGLQHQIRAT